MSKLLKLACVVALALPTACLNAHHSYASDHWAQGNEYASLHTFGDRLALRFGNDVAGATDWRATRSSYGYSNDDGRYDSGMTQALLLRTELGAEALLAQIEAALRADMVAEGLTPGPSHAVSLEPDEDDTSGPSLARRAFKFTSAEMTGSAELRLKAGPTADERTLEVEISERYH